MIYWLLGAIILDVLVLLTGFSLQARYLRHIRHYHRPIWEALNHRCSPRWRYFKGMPSTGLLISTYIGDREYRTAETPAYLWMGRFVIFLNLLHVVVLGTIIVLSIALFAF